jgi:hypothetical protein
MPARQSVAVPRDIPAIDIYRHRGFHDARQTMHATSDEGAKECRFPVIKDQSGITFQHHAATRGGVALAGDGFHIVEHGTSSQARWERGRMREIMITPACRNVPTR